LIINRNKHELPACHLSRLINNTDIGSPNLYINLYRDLTCINNIRVTAHSSAHFNRTDEIHVLSGDRHQATSCSHLARDACRQIHLRNQPTTKDIAVRIRVLRHRESL
jgi:hypothetical protein